jgi:hypothetical protein
MLHRVLLCDSDAAARYSMRESSERYDAIVLGGGAAGLMCAIEDPDATNAAMLEFLKSL